MEVSGLTPGWSTKILHSTEKKEKERKEEREGGRKEEREEGREPEEEAEKSFIT